MPASLQPMRVRVSPSSIEPSASGFQLSSASLGSFRANHETNTFSQITLGEAQRQAVRKKQNDALGPEVKAALEAKLETDKAARKEGKEVSEGWAGSDDLNARVLEWFFREGAEAGEANKAQILKRALCCGFV